MAIVSIDIVNQVRNQLKLPGVPDIDYDELTTVISEICDSSLKSVVGASGHPWSFAIKRQMLTHDTANTHVEFKNSFDLPMDFVNVDRLYKVENGIPMNELVRMGQYDIQGRTLFSNEGNVYLAYTSSDIARYTLNQTFIEALVFYVAAAISPMQANDYNLAQYFMQRYIQSMSQAIRVDISLRNRQGRAKNEAITTV